MILIIKTLLKQVEKFIDAIITSSSSDTPEELVNLQYHKCTHTCRRTERGKTICRFNAPFIPMDRTRILEKYIPSDDQEMLDLRDLHDRLINAISHTDSNITKFDDLLKFLGCDLDKYILSVRSSLTRTRIFIKRSPKDIRINPFSLKIISLMRSNMDIQFVLNAYACVGYVVDYINKSNRGMSKLLRECSEDIQQGNLTIRQKLKRVGNAFYNGTEVSAQEAAWCRLRLPMSHSSVVTEFINTSPINDRTRIVKPPAKLRLLEENSEDIFEHGSIERYVVRPRQLENCCLADFVANYNFNAKKISKSCNDDQQVDEEEMEEEIYGNQQTLELMDNSGTLSKRRKSKIIRFRRYNIHQDESNYFRELIMLFLPWRNETHDVERQNCKQLYKDAQDQIDALRKKYSVFDVDLDIIFDEIQMSREADTHQLHDQTEEVNEGNINPYHYDENDIQPNFMVDIGHEVPIDMTRKFTCPDQLSSIDFHVLINTLNSKQRDFLMHVVSAFKLEGYHLPMYHFVSGGAGVGKRRLIKAIFQALSRLFRQKRGSHEDIEILLVAPTGCAAHNIGGMTAHSAFSLPVNQLTEDVAISADLSNTLATKFKNLKLIIIDEISMVGSKQLNNIHRRLCQIFKRRESFANISIICFGDFNQLRPVGDRYVFQPRNDNLAQLVDNPLWAKFTIFELTEIMRQREDLQFANALARMSTGLMTSQDIMLFRSRCFTSHDNLPQNAKEAVHLFATNMEVDFYNNKRLNEIALTTRLQPSNDNIVVTSSFISSAIDRVVGQCSPAQKDLALQSVSKLPIQSTYGLPKLVNLQLGVRYMVTNNIDVPDGLFNGAIGTLRYIEMRLNRIRAVWIEFTSIDIGLRAKSSREKTRPFGVNNNWTPLTTSKKMIYRSKNSQVQVHREQFPLVVAEGITIHKSQGQSMSQVVVTLKARLERSMQYVAFTRATHLQGLFLIGQFKPPQPILQTNPVVLEIERLRRNPLIPTFEILHEVPMDYLQIISHNCQSLNAHLPNIISDPVYTKSHFILLQETWSLSSDHPSIPGFTEIIKNDISSTRRLANGTSIYVSDEQCTSVHAVGAFEFVDDQQHIEMTTCKTASCTFVNIYVSPQTTLYNFKLFFNNKEFLFTEENLFLFGDFNTSFNNPNNDMEIYLKETFDLDFLSSRISTTDNNTAIDAVFAKFLNMHIKVFMYESLFSYHKPIILRYCQF